MLFNTLKTCYRQFGGMRVVRLYAKMGVLKPMVKEILSNPFNRQSYKNAYFQALRKLEPILMEKYAPVMREHAEAYKRTVYDHKKSRKVWFCWLQGLERAPLIVKVCYSSLQKHLQDREIVVIDENNWRDFVTLPTFIISKWEERKITSAHFTDLIRLQLLIQYGGTWIDSTVLCTGLTEQNAFETASFLDADLFLFQYTKPGSGQWGGVGNWFISSCTNNEVLMTLRDMLYAYWKEYDCVLNYFIFHQFITMLREVYPKEIATMPYGFARRSITLGYNLGKTFEEERWNKLTNKVCFHKLTYKLRSDVVKSKKNYYHYIIALYNQEG